jgi:hypothetical protein
MSEGIEPIEIYRGNYLKMSINSSILPAYNSVVFNSVTSPTTSAAAPNREHHVTGAAGNRSVASPGSINAEPVKTYTPYGKSTEVSFWKAHMPQDMSDLPEGNIEGSGNSEGSSKETGEVENNENEVSSKSDIQPELVEKGLTEQEKTEVTELKKTDRKIKMHEMAHMAAGGQYAGGATYTYKNGPDGRQYAVGGEVSIDASKGKNPEKTVQKMSQIKRAALAPADPSATDRAIAAKAAQMKAGARLEMIQLQVEERQASAKETSPAEFASSIKLYKRNETLIDSRDKSNHTNPASQSSNMITGEVEALKSSYSSGNKINLFS